MNRAPPISILFNTPDPAIVGTLSDLLSDSAVCLIACEPGVSFLETARRERPVVAVLDHVEQRPDAVQMEIALLKEMRESVRIIVVSRQPSSRDTEVVQRGVFFYIAAPEPHELVRVIRAAAQFPPAATTAQPMRASARGRR